MSETYTTNDFVRATAGTVFVANSPETETRSETFTSAETTPKCDRVVRRGDEDTKVR